jgi:hypothetical protein
LCYPSDKRAYAVALRPSALLNQPSAGHCGQPTSAAATTRHFYPESSNRRAPQWFYPASSLSRIDERVEILAALCKELGHGTQHDKRGV